MIAAKDAAPVVARSLREGLGEDYESKIRPSLCKHFAQGIRWRPVLMPFPIRHPEVECVRDIQFDRQKGIDLRLDLYRHRSAPRNAPTLLQIHGGAWVIGDKREQALPLLYQLASRGWVCASVNYRLSPHATFPEHLQDVKKALAWIREHGEEYGANPDFIVVTGGSAGGHLAALVGLTENDPEYQPGFEEVDTSVRACVPVYGVYDFTDRHGFWNGGLAKLLETKVLKGSIDEIPDEYRKASPMDRIHSGIAPFCVIHGDGDSLVPVAEAHTFVRMLREQSREPVVYMEIPGAQHAFELFPSLRSQAVVDGIERFCAWVYSRYLDVREGSEATAQADAAMEATPGEGEPGREETAAA
jgi:acetyl esterase/lipase